MYDDSTTLPQQQTTINYSRQSDKTYTIYALSDPRTQEVKYIGMSCDIEKRYRQHVSGNDKSNKEKQAWIDQLKSLGLRPVLIALEEGLDKHDALSSERWWIQDYLERDAALTNMRDSTLLPIEQRISAEEMQKIVEERMRQETVEVEGE